MSNTVDLYKLPKDILVKLLATIREDAKKECEKEMRKIFDKLKNSSNWGLSECHFKDCKKYAIYYYGDVLYSNSEESFSCCHNCFDNYCYDHSKMRKIEGEPYCVECFEDVLHNFDSHEGLTIE